MNQEPNINRSNSFVSEEKSEGLQNNNNEMPNNSDTQPTNELAKQIKTNQQPSSNPTQANPPNPNNELNELTKTQKEPKLNLSNELDQEITNTRLNGHLKKNTKPFLSNLTIHNNSNNFKDSKTVFTKLSEDMYNNFINGNDTDKGSIHYKKYDFDSLINERFIQSYAEKFKEHNNSKFKDFLARNSKPKNRVINGQNGNKSSPDLKSKKTREERNKEINSFLKNQENFLEKKQQNLLELQKKVSTETNQNYTSIPQINENSNTIINQLRINNPDEYNNNVFVKLFEEKKNKTKKEALIAKVQADTIKQEDIKDKGNAIIYPKKPAPKKLTDAEIKDLVDNLHKPKSRIKSNNDNAVYLPVKTTPNKELSSLPSNSILIQRFLKSFDIEASNMFNKRSDENQDLTYNDVKELLYKLGFISEQDDEKENALIKEAWDILINKQSNNENNTNQTENKQNEEVKKDEDNIENIPNKEQKIQSFDLILFLLCVLNLYKGGTSQLIDQNIPFIDLTETSPHIIKPKQAKQIQFQFRDFFNNSMDHLFKQKTLSKTLRLNDQANANKQKSSNNIHLTSSPNLKNRPIKTYDIIQKKREKTNEILRAEKQAKEFKECTFYPNNRNPNLLSPNVSTEVTNRLYSQRPQRQLKQSDPSKKSENEIYSFTPAISKIDNKMFTFNPIKDDKSVNEKVEQYEKARMDKKLNNYLLKQGTHVISNYEIINNLNSQTDPPISFRFDNEYKGYKNTFEKFNKKKGLNHNDNQEREIKYVFEFNVENQIKSLKIYKGDNIAKCVNKFCNENNLEVESKERILSAIKEKIAKT